MMGFDKNRDAKSKDKLIVIAPFKFSLIGSIKVYEKQGAKVPGHIKKTCIFVPKMVLYKILVVRFFLGEQRRKN